MGERSGKRIAVNKAYEYDLKVLRGHKGYQQIIQHWKEEAEHNGGEYPENGYVRMIRSYYTHTPFVIEPAPLAQEEMTPGTATSRHALEHHVDFDTLQAIKSEWSSEEYVQHALALMHLALDTNDRPWFEYLATEYRSLMRAKERNA